jgi:protein SCO1/2
MSDGFRILASTAALVLGALAVVSCERNGIAERPRQTPTVSTHTSTNRQTYEVKGVVRELVLERKKVKVAHEAIPGYMEAMTMLLDVKDANELKDLQPGDNISFRMVVLEDDGWIENIKKLGTGPRTPVPTPEPIRRVREVEPLSVGDMVPEYAFTNMLGQVIRLSELKGRAVGFTFIFTRCPFPTFCPRLNTTFQQAHNRLKAMTNGPANWTLLSITMDPEYDTVSRLKDYAQRYNLDTNHWQFVTGDLTDITAIGEQFGLQFWRPKPNDPISHNVRTVVVDASGRVQWVTNENEFKADDLAAQMVKAAAVK